MFIHIKFLTKNSDSKTCFIPKDIFNTLKLKEEIKYGLHVGQLSKKVYVKPNKDNDSKSMYLSQDIVNKLCLLFDITLNIWKKDNDIYLGPVVGIIQNSRYVAAIKEGEPHISAQIYAKENRKAHCLLYFLTPRDISYAHNKLHGYYFEYKDNKWKEKDFPVPDVIYDRCSVIDVVENLSKKYKTLQLITHISHN
ncbi:MAG: hypothetical protein N4A57_12160 [Anaeromicrobium sp.]|uniref:hypothetical protein n=1 Tax=Anaeromicrobium sp. TaxID=1929132 RepID=UPI0025D0A7CF|nr:hypothetical protein [Anaeromicrobium sp.]MCT4595007.1 hypothetical protein [Anaeromicrobium sp.]